MFSRQNAGDDLDAKFFAQLPDNRSYPLPQRAFQHLVEIQVLLGNYLKERDRERRIRLARFPQTKSFDTFDFAAQPSLNKALVLELTRCEWIDRRQNGLALGPSGTGKTD